MVRQLGQFLDPDAGMAQDLDGGPGPEPAVLFEGQVAASAGAGSSAQVRALPLWP